MDRIAAAAAADGRIYLIAGKTLWTSTPSGAGLVRGVEVLDRTGPPEFAWLGEGVAGVVDLGGRVANTWRGEWTAMAIRPGSPRTLLLAERGGGIRSIPERKRAGDSLPGKELLHVGEPVARMAAGIAGDRQVLVLVTASGRILVADLPPRPMPAEPPGRGVRVTRKQGGPRGEAPAPADVAAGGAAQDAAATQDAAAAEPAGAEPNDQVEWQPDAPSSRRGDTLRRGALAEALATRLRTRAATDRTTFLLLLDGRWGSGKSSVLRMLTELLETGEPRWAVARYDAWRQSRVGRPWWTLLNTIRGTVFAALPGRRRRVARIREFWRMRISRSPAAGALVLVLAVAVGLFALLRPVPFGLASVDAAVRSVAAVGAALATLWGGSFVVARFVLWESARGARFFEESAENPMTHIADHVGWLVGQLDRPLLVMVDDLDRRKAADVVEILESVQTLVRDAPGPHRDGAQPGQPTRTEHALARYAPLLPPNPRSMKRFVNDYTMARAVRLLEGDPVPVDALARWTVLRQRWPVLAAHLAEHPDAVDGDPAHRPDGLTEELAALFGGADVRRVLADGALSADLVRRCRGG